MMGPTFFIQSCVILGNLPLLKYAYSQQWFSISDLYYIPLDHPLHWYYSNDSACGTYSPFNTNANCPLFLSLIYHHRDIYLYFKELLKKETTIYHPSSIKELRDDNENTLLYWLIRNNWKEEYEEVLEHYRISDPLDLHRLQSTSKSNENIFHIVYSMNDHPLQSHPLFQLPLLFPHRIPLFSDCVIYLSLLEKNQKVNDVITTTFDLNNFNQSNDIHAKKKKDYFIQFIEFLFEFVPLICIRRSLYSLVDNCEPITSMRFTLHRNILHLILSNPTKCENTRYKHFQFIYKRSPELLFEKDFTGNTPIVNVKGKTLLFILKNYFVDALLLLDLRKAANGYYDFDKSKRILKEIVQAILYLEKNFTEGFSEEVLKSKFLIPKTYLKLMKEKLNSSLCSSIVRSIFN